MAQLNSEQKNSAANETAAPAPVDRGAMWLMIAFSMSIVLSTVLFSNDMRHLRSVMALLEYKPLPTAIHSPPLIRQARVFKPVAVRIIPRLIAAPETKLAGVLLRAWRRNGKQYCDAVRETGINLSSWKGSELSETGTYECSFERSWSDGPEERSVFYLVRGNSSGSISTIRAKLVNPQTTASGELAPEIAAALMSFVDAAGWTDLTKQTAGSIVKLQDVKLDAFGAALSFSREPTSKASFNLIVSTSPATELQKKNYAYFDKEGWLPLSDERSNSLTTGGPVH